MQIGFFFVVALICAVVITGIFYVLSIAVFLGVVRLVAWILGEDSPNPWIEEKSK